MRVKTFPLTLRLISAVVLFFFVWTFGSVWEAVAFAATSSKTDAKARATGKPASGKQRPEEKFEGVLDAIRDHVNKAGDKAARGADETAELDAIKTRKNELEGIDAELRAGFLETEKKLKAAKLPQQILDRHAAFVKNYETNLAQLKSEIDDLDKAKTKADRRTKIEKARLHLEKVKKPKLHKKLDPDNLPFSARKATKAHAPRLKREDFERDFPKQHKAVKMAGLKAELAANVRGWARTKNKPVQFAFNGPDSDIPFTLPRPTVGEGWGEGRIPQLAFNDSSPLLLAQASVQPTPDDLAETPDIRFTPELQQIATLLENNPVQMYEFVRNNFMYDPYYGSIKGSQSTLLLQSGNDFDQASVLIALFRLSGIPARYVYGTVEIPIEKVMKWLGGITDPQTAGLLLATNGIPAKFIMTGSTIKSVQLEHVWTEVYIPYANYRGLINDPASQKTWIPLDPSFKLTDANPNAVDMADLQQFDIDTYLTNYLQTVKPTTPAKDYLSTTINYVTNNLPGQRFYDLLASGPIVDKVLGLLPDTLSYPVKTVGAKFYSIPESYRHKITFDFADPGTGETILTYSAAWSDLLHNRFTISYVPATSADEQVIANYSDIYATPPYLINVKPVLKVDGTTVAEGNSVDMAGDLILKMSFIGPQGTVDNIITNNLTVGATHAIGLGSGYTTGRIITYRTAKLDTAATAGEQGDSTIGEYLNLLALNYLQELDSSRKLVSRSMKILDTYRSVELMVGVDLGVSRIFGIPRSVSVNGLLLDVDYNIATPVEMDGKQSNVRRFQILAGMTSSALEHRMFESIVGVEAVSTIKALEIANVQGIPVHQIDASNIATKLPLLQLSSEMKTDIQNAINVGKVVTVSERNIQLNNWYGVGYIVMDPTTGAGAYMISSGLSGGSLTQMTSTLSNWIKSGQMTKEAAVQIIIAHKCLIWFPMPVDGTITSKYDSSRPYGIHGAVDIAVNNWTPVQAVAAGTVLKIGYADAYTSDTGYYVEIDHGAGVVTRYLHNCQINVIEKQLVNEGEAVALSGNTGHVESAYITNPGNYPRCQSDSSFGSHVHFELKINGDKVDPELYGKWDKQCGAAQTN